MNKNNVLFLTTLLSFFLILTMYQEVKAQTGISSIMGKPVYESTVDSLNTKVWIISQKKYLEIMKTQIGKTMSETNDKNKNTDKDTRAAMTAGTHYLIYDVTNITSGKEFADTSAKIEIVSPTKKISSVNLQPLTNYFGSGVSLTEKGDYLFTINLNVGVSYRTTQFKYKVK